MLLSAKVHLVTLAAGFLGITALIATEASLTPQWTRREMRTRADLLMAGIDADRHYAETQIIPLLRETNKTQFLPQTSPFYGAEKSFERAAKDLRGELRITATNPTNEADRPVDWEIAIIRTFATQPEVDHLVVERDSPAGAIFSLAKPIVADASCLPCHGVPDQAPRPMLDIYGAKNGFGWRVHDVIGAQIISLPEATVRQESRHSAVALTSLIAVAVAIMLAVLDLLAQIAIIKPLQRLAERANAISLGDLETGGLPTIAHTEVGLLAQAFDRMRTSLAIAMRMLQA